MLTQRNSIRLCALKLGGNHEKDCQAIVEINGMSICVYINLLRLHHGIIIVLLAPFYFISTPPPQKGELQKSLLMGLLYLHRFIF